MPELTDYSGPFKPDLQFDDLSKDFLLKLIRIWQFAWLHMARAWYEAIQERWGFDGANDCERQAWLTVAERVMPRFPKVANIELNTVLDSLKVLQLPLDNSVGAVFPVRYDIKNPNHVILTIVQCRPLEVVERTAPERIVPMCHVLEKLALEKYLLNPNIKVTPLKLPPRKSPDEIACEWELKLEERGSA